MSTSYTFTKTVSDTGKFYNYIYSVFNTLTDVNAQPPNLTVSFSAALSAPNQTILGTMVSSYIDAVSSTTDGTRRILSVNNSTNTVLGANAVYTGLWDDVSEATTVCVQVKSNVASAASGFTIQYGILSQTADITRNYTLAAGDNQQRIEATKGRFFRIVYTNGAASQTTFTLASYICGTSANPTVSQGETLDDSHTALITRSLLAGRSDIGTYIAAGMDEVGSIRVNTEDFKQPQSISEVEMVYSNFAYSINPELNVSSVVASGTVTYSTGRAAISTAAAINSSGTLRSYYYATVPGYGKLINRFAAAFSSAAATGSTQICGVGDSTDGVFWGYNGTAFGVCTRQASVDTWVSRTSFNIDKLDGTGPSGVTLDPASGNNYAISYDSSGYGDISFWIRRPVTASLVRQGTQGWIEAHRKSFNNAGSATASFGRFQLPCLAQSANTTSATLKTMYLTFYEIIYHGTSTRIPPIVRSFDGADSITSITYLPTISLQNVTTYNSLPNDRSIRICSVSVAMTNGGRNLILAIFTNTTLTGSNFTSPSATTSIAQTDTASTAMSGGIQVFAKAFYGAFGEFDVRDYNIILPPGARMTLACKLGTSGTVTTNTTINWTEYSY